MIKTSEKKRWFRKTAIPFLWKDEHVWSIDLFSLSFGGYTLYVSRNHQVAFQPGAGMVFDHRLEGGDRGYWDAFVMGCSMTEKAKRGPYKSAYAAMEAAIKWVLKHPWKGE